MRLASGLWGEAQMFLSEEFPAVGTYTLILFLSKDTRLKVGRLGTCVFPAGYYAYTGSALGKGSSSLIQRVARHLKKRKHKFWHIDFLLAPKDTTIHFVIALQTNRKTECKLNSRIKGELEARIPVVGFGASDCREDCKSHLLFFPDLTKDHIVEKIVKCYRDVHLHRGC